MNEQDKSINYGDLLINWDIPEYEKHDRTKNWYIAAGVIALLLLIYSFLSGNFLFAVIIVIVALIIILHDGQNPPLITFAITSEGIIVGRKFYDYDIIDNFYIIYKSREEVKNLYFEFKSVVKPRLSIPLLENNPIKVREILLKYLKEDLDKTNQPSSEALAKIFKL